LKIIPGKKHGKIIPGKKQKKKKKIILSYLLFVPNINLCSIKDVIQSKICILVYGDEKYFYSSKKKKKKTSIVIRRKGNFGVVRKNIK